MLDFLRKQMKWVMAIIVVAFLLSTFLMYDRGSTRRTPGRNADGTMTDYEVANINGRSLMRSELERRLRDYLSTYSTRNTASIDIPALYQTVLDQIVLESQLAREVDASGIRVSDAEAEQAMKTYADTYYPTRETFYQALEMSGVKIDDYKKSLARQMAVEQLIRNAVGEVVISEDRAVEFYDTMKVLLYSRPEGYDVHIADFKTSEEAEAMLAKLESGESWDVIASNDELEAINITKSPIFLPVSAFTTGALSVLASVDVGQFSPVFEMSSNDYAVALKTSHVEATVSPYDEVSGDIKGMLTAQEERNRVTAYQTSLMEKAQVVINDQELFARTEVSEDFAPEVPEIEIEEVNEPEPETAPVPEESTPTTEPEEVPAVEETPTPEAETTPEPEETPAVEPETASEPEETPEAATEAETTPEPETPAVVEETPAPEPEEAPEAAIEPKPEETTSVVEEAKPEPEAPEAEVITEPENIPLQEEVTTPEEVTEIKTEPVIDKPAEEIITSSDAE